MLKQTATWTLKRGSVVVLACVLALGCTPVAYADDVQEGGARDTQQSAQDASEAMDAPASEEAQAPSTSEGADELDAVEAIDESGETAEGEAPSEADALAETSGTCVTWKRLAGPVALDTMQKIVQTGWSKSASVVIATQSGYWDALTASGLAGLKDAPVLLTDASSLSAQTSSEIKRLGANTAYVAGGAAAVSDNVVSQLKALGCEVVRSSGQDAIGTANDIYRAGQGAWGKTVVVATSGGYWDALSAAPYAYAKKAPVLLCNAATQRMDADTLACIKSGGFARVVISGGTAAVSEAAERQIEALGVEVERLWGADAYETSLKVAQWELDEGMGVEKIAVATGEGYWDALCGAALCGKNNAVLVLANETHRSAIDGVYKPLKASISTAYVFGGDAAVSASTWNYLQEGLTHNWKPVFKTVNDYKTVPVWYGSNGGKYYSAAEMFAVMDNMTYEELLNFSYSTGEEQLLVGSHQELTGHVCSICGATK